jgi:hypothetical protein
MRRLFALLLPCFVACGDDGSQAAPPPPPAPDPPAAPPVAPPVAPPAPAPFPAPHPAMPEVITLGGKVLTSPRFVVVTYDGDPFREKLEDFAAAIGKTQYWHDVTAEYGVGPASVGRPVHLSEAAPPSIDDAKDLKPWLEAKLDGTHAEWDAPDGQTIYVVYFPEGTTYHLEGFTGCKEFGASDNLLTRRDGSLVPYIAIPRCQNLFGLDAWGTLTAVTSHELFEESTDPFKDAYVTNDDDNLAWAEMPPFSEIGDMCMAAQPLYVQPPDLPHLVQRAWSNAAARAGKNPCVPAPNDGPFFNALPVFADSVPISYGRWSSWTKGVTIPVGQTKTIDVALYSEAAVDEWHVGVFDLDQVLGNAPSLQLRLDRTTGKNGDVLKLTIKSLAEAADKSARFAIVSQRGSASSFAWGLVAQ